MKYDEWWCLQLLVTLEALMSDLVVFNIFFFLSGIRELNSLLLLQGSHHLVRGQVVHVLDRESRTNMKEPLYNTSRCLMTWCPWIFSSTWLFRESGPDANSRSPEAPGCFGDFWTVSLDFDWVWFFCSWGFKFSILLLQQSVRMFVMLLLALPLDSVLGTHRWIDWFFD